MAHNSIDSSAGSDGSLYGYEVSYKNPEETESGKFLVFYPGSASDIHTQAAFVALVEAKLAAIFGGVLAKQIPWTWKAVNITAASYSEYVFP